MFGFKKNHANIDVMFYERGEGAPFAKSKLPIDQLPDTFQIETTLHIQGDDWLVSKTIPTTKEEFQKSGELKVFLYKPVKTTLPAQDILFSLPTISNDIAGLAPATSLVNAFVVHEDEWRQRELVSTAYIGLVESEFDSIRLSYATRVGKSGFKKCHVRSLIPEPLKDVRLQLNDLKSILGVVHTYSGVAFSRVAALVVNGFAFRTSSGYVVWGQCLDIGNVAFVCVQFPQSSQDEPEDTKRFGLLLSNRNLLFVDWVSMSASKTIGRVVRLSDES